jgi:iron complex outermembrane receptor protein
VPIYIDDVYHGRPQGAILDLLDLERVEILRGSAGHAVRRNRSAAPSGSLSRKPRCDNTGERRR